MWQKLYVTSYIWQRLPWVITFLKYMFETCIEQVTSAQLYKRMRSLYVCSFFCEVPMMPITSRVKVYSLTLVLFFLYFYGEVWWTVKRLCFKLCFLNCTHLTTEFQNTLSKTGRSKWRNRENHPPIWMCLTSLCPWYTRLHKHEETKQ